MTKNDQWLHFCTELRGFNLERNNKPIAKYIVFWRGYNSHNILTGKSKVKAVRRYKK